MGFRPDESRIIASTDLSIVVPRCFDTSQSNFIAGQAENPLNVATNRFQIKFDSVPEAETTWRAAVIRVSP